MTKTSEFIELLTKTAKMLQDEELPGTILSADRFIAVVKLLNLFKRDMSDFSSNEAEQIVGDFDMKAKQACDVY